MNRNWKLPLVSTLLLFSCGGRHIEYGAGSGPQGGPGYKPEPPTSLTPVISVYAFADFEYSNQEWAFGVYESYPPLAINSEIHFTSNLAEHQIKSPWEPYWSIMGGDVRCLAPSNNIDPSLCTDVHVVVPPISAGHPQLAHLSFGFKAHIQRGCQMSGQFPWEQVSSIWASGREVSITIDDSVVPGAFIQASPNVVRLSTDERFADQTTRDMTLPLSINGDTKKFVSLDMKFPTQSLDGTRVSISNDNYPLAVDGDQSGHYQGDLKFRKVGTGQVTSAHVDITCGSRL